MGSVRAKSTASMYVYAYVCTHILHIFTCIYMPCLQPIRAALAPLGLRIATETDPPHQEKNESEPLMAGPAADAPRTAAAAADGGGGAAAGETAAAGERVTWFDPKVLAAYLLSARVLRHPVSRRLLARADCEALGA